MKPKLKLLLVIATASLGLAASACRAEAEQTDGAESNATAQAEQANAEPAEGSPFEDLPDEPGTDPGDTNIVINQEITVLEEVPPTTPPNLNLSEGVEAIVKLAQSGVSETVILTFIETTNHEYHLDAPSILYLSDIGVPSTVIAAMLNHDGAPQELKEMVEEGAQMAEAPEPGSEGTVEPISRPILEGDFGATVSAPAQAQAPVEVTTNYIPAEAQTVVQQQPVVVEQPVVVQQPVVYTQPAVTHSYFYSSLAPYGSWIFVNDYGWCWQPTIAVSHSGWRPYTHGGRWLWSDAGWYWQSNYSWGWAPFHYGRWFSSPHRGWVWVPGYTWGPSWVTWRRTSYYCGWAPLPPRAHYRHGIGFTYFGRRVGFDFHFGLGHEHFSFVHKRDFCDRRLVHRIMPTARTINIYKQSTVINNIVVGNNNTIINRGVDRDVIARHVRTEIPKVGVRDIPSGRNRLVQPERLRKQGSELVVFRPKPPSSELAAAAASATRSELGRRPDPSDLVRPRTPLTGRAALAAAEKSKAPSRSEVSRSVAAGRTSTSPAAPSRQVEPSRGRSTTWATPAPFVPPPAETPTVSTRGTTRTETGRAALWNRGTSGRSGLVTTRPSTSGRTPATVTQPTPASPSPSRGVISGSRNEVTSRTSPWTSRSQAIAPKVTPAPSQGGVRQVVPSTQSRLGVSRPSAPSLGSSPVPGSNVGTPTGRAAIYGTPRSAATPTPRSLAPTQNRTTFNNPLTVRPAPTYVPQRPARTLPAPVTTPTVPSTRNEAITRPPTVAPQVSGRAASPLYQPSGRAASPLYRPSPSPSGRAASPLYQPRSAAPRPAPAPRISPAPQPRSSAPPARSVAPARPTGRAAIYGSPSRSSAPPATGRGRMEIRR